jgi:threonine dehydrogenase-like Zn-dependent dehydrogenase
MGATHIFNNSKGDLEEFVEDVTNGEMADVVVEAIGYQETYQQAFRIVKKGGRVVFFGMIRDLDEGKFFKLNFDDVFRKEITIIPSYGPHLIKDIKVAVELIGDEKIDVKPLITHHFKFDDIDKAFEIAHSKNTNPIKVIVDF